MNKKAQLNMDWEELIKLIIILPILLALIGAIFGVLNSINQDNCPQCEDCSPYKEDLANLSEQLEVCKNQSKEIVYVNQTVEIPVEKEVIIYKERWFPSTIISISFILSLVLTISLFKIKLPEKIEGKLEKLEKWIVRIKRASLVLTILIFIRLLIMLFSLF
ncbi:hypothetical protein DRN69_02810 [Candidatus Pacearchaeota archaeon]|nr:MAG: hypothetical protein DRN69_02810 [Candidatus Pacearchaeota archaeon]